MSRTLLLAASFPPVMGGIETLLYQTMRRLPEPPLVLAPPPAVAQDMVVEPLRPSGLARASYRPLWRLHPALWFSMAFWRQASEATKRLRPAVVQAGHVYLAHLAHMLARHLGRPFIVYAYGQEVYRPGRAMGLPRLDWRLRGGTLRAASRVLVPGAFTAALLGTWGVDPRRVITVPYGAEPRPASPLPPGERLLSVARLVPRKGIDTVIRALPQLPASVTYRVVGAGPDLDRLRAEAEASGVASRVTFLGRVDQPALADEYRRCTIFVLPARRTVAGDLEGYGLVYFEAAAWGRPVIAGRSGGEADAVVDGETGVLVDGTSPRCVADAIRTLLSDRRRLEAMGDAGRRRVESTHNWAAAASTIQKTLAEIA